MGNLRFDSNHELLRDSGPVPSAIILCPTKQVNFPIRLLSA